MGSGEQLVARLQGICGAEHVLTHPDALATYRSDGLAHYRQMPLAAVLPETAEQVQRVVTTCFEAEVPWVARGSGTGLSGGALPIAEGVLIVLARLRRIISIAAAAGGTAPPSARASEDDSRPPSTAAFASTPTPAGSSRTAALSLSQG